MSKTARSIKRSLLGRDEPKSTREEVEEVFTCSYRTQLIGFGVCLGVGIILSIMSTLTLPQRTCQSMHEGLCVCV